MATGISKLSRSSVLNHDFNHISFMKISSLMRSICQTTVSSPKNLLARETTTTKGLTNSHTPLVQDVAIALPVWSTTRIHQRRQQLFASSSKGQLHRESFQLIHRRHRHQKKNRGPFTLHRLYSIRLPKSNVVNGGSVAVLDLQPVAHQVLVAFKIPTVIVSDTISQHNIIRPGYQTYD